jgi:endonuclease-3
MALTLNKPRLLTHLFASLKGRYGGNTTDDRPVLEQLVYAICREGTTREKADLAYANLKERFIDWNEVRVSSPHEVEEAMADLPDVEVRAHRVLSLLQEVFETTFSFDLEAVQKKGPKLAGKQLARYQAVSDFAVAWVTQHTLGEVCVPVDAPSLRVLRRLGLVDGTADDPESLHETLIALVPKNRIALFNDVISAVAEESCDEDEPRCNRCPLRSECPTGQEAPRAAVPAGRNGRSKPR